MLGDKIKKILKNREKKQASQDKLCKPKLIS
jgi:hypothetical protein